MCLCANDFTENTKYFFPNNLRFAAPTTGMPGRRRFNGYTLYWKTRMDARVPLAGESNDQCRQRIMTECLAQWKDNSDDGVALRKSWGDRAKVLNAALKNNDGSQLVSLQSNARFDASICSVPDENQHDNRTRLQQLVPVPDPNSSSRGSCGPFGLGDETWAIKESIVSTADSTIPAFVRTFSNNWKTRAGGTVSGGNQLPDYTVRLSCHEKFGFCMCEIQNMHKFKEILNQLRQKCCKSPALALGEGEKYGSKLEASASTAGIETRCFNGLFIIVVTWLPNIKESCTQCTQWNHYLLFTIYYLLIFTLT